jgi:hypothetical protein
MSRPVLTALTLSLFALTGCGREAFKVVETSQQQQAPGSYTIPPKVDILLAEDDTGSAFEPYATISQQVLDFVNGIDQNDWDYHFATIPLTTDRPLTQVMGSKYDSNWGSQWKPSYPGETQWGPGTIVTDFFRTISNYSGLLGQNEINLNSGGLEPGFETIRKALYGRVQPTGFLRQDALTVVVIVSNGEDTSQVNMCPQFDGRTILCERANYPSYPACSDPFPQNVGENCQNSGESFDYYKWQFAGAKSNPNSIKFYAVVSGSHVSDSSCYGGNAYNGGRYMSMAGASGGQSYGICNGSIADALAGIKANLTTQRLAMRTRYLFIDQAPDVSTLQVIKFHNGDQNEAEELPQDSTNGWTYVGQVTNVYAIDSPIPMNLESGYAIELHGTAKLLGDDSAIVNFKPAGAGDSRTP